jgi:hypothetical protein
MIPVNYQPANSDETVRFHVFHYHRVKPRHGVTTGFSDPKPLIRPGKDT